jgi:hypothetical protein
MSYDSWKNVQMLVDYVSAIVLNPMCRYFIAQW